MSTPCGYGSASHKHLVADIRGHHGSRVARTPIVHVMNGLRLGSVLRSQRLGEAAVGALNAIVSHSGDPGAAVPAGTVNLPSRVTLQRARVRAHVADMLWHRWTGARERRCCFRYLAYDAIPQRGVDIFATVQRVLTVLSSDGRTPVAAVHERRLPLLTLGHGRTVPPCQIKFRRTCTRRAWGTAARVSRGMACGRVSLCVA